MSSYEAWSSGGTRQAAVVEREGALAAHLAKPTAETRAAVVAAYRQLAHAVADRYGRNGGRNGGRDDLRNDLRQVAFIGLLRAVDRYDPSRGVRFVTYAWALADGEVRSYVRDRVAVVRAPRRLHVLRTHALAAQDQLAAHLGRTPTHAELAAHLGVDRADLEAAFDTSGATRPASLDGEDGVLDVTGSSEEMYDAVHGRLWFEQLLTSLSDRERRIVWMRFAEERTQMEIADALGISQMHVSRLLRRILGRLRTIAIP